MNPNLIITLLFLAAFVIIIIHVSKFKYLYATIYYVDGNKKDFGPFESERSFCKWLYDHEMTNEVRVSDYKLEYRDYNTNINLTT